MRKTRKQALDDMEKYFTEMKNTCNKMLGYIKKERKKLKNKKRVII